MGSDTEAGADAQAQAGAQAEAEAEAEALVRKFLETVDANDAEALRPFLADDVVYHNIPMDPVIGADDAIAFLAGFMGMCDKMEIETHHLAVRGNVVLTERTDTFTLGQVVAPLPVMGTFELRQGRIAAWRDYFDLGQITKMLSGEG